MTARVLATPGPYARPFGIPTLVVGTVLYLVLLAVLWWEAEPLRLFVPHGGLVGYIVLIVVWRRGELIQDRERVAAVRQVLRMKERASVVGTVRPYGSPSGMPVALTYPFVGRRFATLDTTPFVLESDDGRRVLVDPEHSILVSGTGTVAFGERLRVTGPIAEEHGHRVGGRSGYRGGGPTEVLRGTEGVPIVLTAA